MESDPCDILCCGSAIILLDLEGHPLSFRKCPEPRHIDGGVVNKNISATFFFDETVPFLITEPLDNTICLFQNSFLLLTRLVLQNGLPNPDDGGGPLFHTTPLRVVFPAGQYWV